MAMARELTPAQAFATEATKLMLTVPEATERTGLSRSVLYRHMTAGTLAYIKVGRSRRIEAAELERWVAWLRHQTRT